MAKPLVGVIMGSSSDWETMGHASPVLKEFGVPHERKVVSAHRTPALMAAYAAAAESRGLEVIIAGAGGAAHLPGMTAGHTVLPVLGVPVESKALKGLDSLLSIAQMPAGVPVGTLSVGVAGAKNAALLAIAILALKRPDLKKKLRAFRSRQTQAVLKTKLPLMDKPILPGATVGVLGSGQLGRMFALAARRMGYRVHTYSPDSDTPTGQVADVEVSASYEDESALRAFAQKVDVVTFEFENVPSKALDVLESLKPVRPRGEVLHISQNRLREKGFLSKKGFPVAGYRAVQTLEELEAGLKALGVPAVLKTANSGYDGKGQVKIQSPSEAAAAFASLKGAEAVLESFVDFTDEVSVVAARAANGATAHWGTLHNTHASHILDVTTAPAPIHPGIAGQAVEMAQEILKALDVVGVLCVEFFVGKKGLLVNELAPRPHNSGHLTLDACVTSQFEQQLRAVCNLPLGDTSFMAPGAAMANLLGDLWTKGEPAWRRALLLPDVKLHLYGKTEPRPGRKMGHLTALAATPQEAAQRVVDARRALQNI